MIKTYSSICLLLKLDRLSGADLRRADLSEADLSGADLHGADLGKANLYEAELYEANLHGADLTEVYLHKTNLRKADLRKANLRKADLRKANLRWANLSDANLYEAELYEANLHGADLTEATGILSVGPSTDGWLMFGYVFGGEIRIKAGCRDFTVKEARSHWRSTRGGTVLGRERLEDVSFIARRLKRWETTPPVDRSFSGRSAVNQETELTFSKREIAGPS